MYKEKDLVRIGTRYGNKKRNYLLINPLQGKHLPVSPNKCLEMFTRFGRQLKTKYPNTKLIIGFAETATAIGLGVANEFDNCMYLQTTREDVLSNSRITFSEEHSHATEQFLVDDTLDYYISNTDTVIFIDDEISTGKTLINILDAIKEKHPAICDKTIVVASIINRMSADDERRMLIKASSLEYLLRLTNTDYASTEGICEPTDTIMDRRYYGDYDFYKFNLVFNPRTGVVAKDYHRMFVEAFTDSYWTLPSFFTENILVIGTEECMYPAILLADVLHKRGHKVKTHSTTRSPIGVLNDGTYPIKNGFKIPSLYDADRTTFIYNLNKRYKSTTVIIVTDAHEDTYSIGLQSLISLFGRHNVSNFIVFEV